jgi:hypothetical protein
MPPMYNTSMGAAAGGSDKQTFREPSPEPPKYATTAGHDVGGATQEEPDALLDREAHGPHRRRVPHVRARLRERVRVQARLFEVPLVDGRVARAGGR